MTVPSSGRVTTHEKAQPGIPGHPAGVGPGLGVATYFVHDFQMKRNAKSLLDMADEAQAKGKPEKAAESLSRYLELEKRDGKTYERYARVLDELYKDEPRRQGQVLEVYQEALRFNPEDPKLLRRCAELAMTPGLNRANDARTHWNALLKQHVKDPADPERAEIDEKLAECFARESNFDKAVESYQEAISIDKTRITSYVNLAELGRQERARTRRGGRPDRHHGQGQCEVGARLAEQISI